METLRQGSNVGGYAMAPTSAQRDTLATRLAQINEELAVTEKLAHEAIQRLGIPLDVADGNKVPPSPGLHGCAMEIGNRLARTRRTLETVVDFLN
mgnify:FL=1